MQLDLKAAALDLVPAEIDLTAAEFYLVPAGLDSTVAGSIGCRRRLIRLQVCVGPLGLDLVPMTVVASPPQLKSTLHCSSTCGSHDLASSSFFPNPCLLAFLCTYLPWSRHKLADAVMVALSFAYTHHFVDGRSTALANPSTKKDACE